MVFENGVKNIQAAAYNGARTVLTTFWGYKDKGKGLLHFLDDIPYARHYKPRLV